MIDFASSYPGVDVQARACCKLLAAVLVQAIRDAAEPLSMAEKRLARNLQFEPRKAVTFLFDPDHQTCAAYCNLIGVSLPQLRRALLEDRGADDVVGTKLFRDGLQLRRVRVREKFYRLEQRNGMAVCRVAADEPMEVGA